MINVIQNTIGVGSLAFNPSQLTNGAVWYDPASDYINVKAGAKFTAANSEELTSTSIDFDKGDEDFSFGGWFRINSGTTNQGIMGKYTAAGNQRSYILVRSIAAEKFRFVMSENGVSSSDFADWGSTLTQNQYYFVVCVYDSTNDLMKLSVDGGEFVTTAHVGGAYASSTADFIFGNYGGGNNADMTADHCFFYDKALSHAEVLELYNSASGVAYADMAGISGNTRAIGQKFDGTDDGFNIDAVRTDLASTTTGSWEVWVNPTDATPAANAHIISFGDTNAVELMTLQMTTTGTCRASLNIAGVAKWQFATDSAVFSDNTPTHVMLVQDGVEPKIYIDNVEVAQSFSITTDKTAWFSVATGLDNGRIGCSSFNSGGNSAWTPAILDSIGFWNRAITSDERTELYGGGSGVNYDDMTAGLTSGLVSYFKMNDVEGANQTDSHGSNNATPISVPKSTTGKVVNTTLADMTTSLVSFWEFDEASGNRADTHGTNTLTDVNTVTTGPGVVQSSVTDQDTAWKITDRYGNHDLSNDDGAGQPIWNQNSGLPFLEFDGVDDFLSKDVADWLSGSTSGSIYMVCQSDSTNTEENGFCSSDNATDNHYLAVQNSVSSLNDSSRILTRISGTVASVYGDTDITDSTVRLLEFHSNGTAYELLIDGTSETVNEQTGGDDTGNFYGDVSNRDNISMGALLRSSVLYFPSKFFEIIVTSSESSAVEKLNVRNYLTNKYSI